MRYCSILFIIIIIGGLCSCRSEPPEQLIRGAWQVDSTYSFYNGFEYRQSTPGSDWATYIYDTQGTVKEAKYGTFRPYQYRFDGKNLIWTTPDASEEIPFEILALNRQRMVLRRDKPPLFPGKGQVRYEIRYFSRIDTTEIPDLQQFTPPVQIKE